MTKILNVLGCPEEEVSLVLVSDRKIRDLNREYRQINRTTDVLSFSAREGDFPLPPDSPLGDVLVSVETAARQAKDIGHSFDAEVERLVIHGILHLLGYDHADSKDRRRMKAKERWIAAKLKKQ